VFNVGDHVYLKEKPNNITLSFGNFLKLVPKYCVPFEDLAKIGSVDYDLALPLSIKVHNLFHVCLSKWYEHDATHVIDLNMITLEPTGKFYIEPLRILGTKELMLPNHAIVQI